MRDASARDSHSGEDKSRPRSCPFELLPRSDRVPEAGQLVAVPIAVSPRPPCNRASGTILAAKVVPFLTAIDIPVLPAESTLAGKARTRCCGALAAPFEESPIGAPLETAGSEALANVHAPCPDARALSATQPPVAARSAAALIRR